MIKVTLIKPILSIILIWGVASNLLAEPLNERFEGAWESIYHIDKRVIRAPENRSVELSPDTSRMTIEGNKFEVQTYKNKYSGNISVSADTLIFIVNQLCKKTPIKDSLICSNYDLVEYMIFRFLCEDFLKLSFPVYIDTIDCSESVRTKCFLMEGDWDNTRPYQRVKD